MTGREILLRFYKLVHDHYALAIPDFDNQLLVDSNDVIVDNIRATPTIVAKPKIHDILNVFKESKIGSDYLDDEFDVLEDVKIIDFSLAEFQKRNRAFSYSDTEFGYLSLVKLSKISPLSSISSTSTEYRTLIDFISTAIEKGEDIKVTTLLDLIENSDLNSGLLVHKIVPTNSDLSTYSYLYYKELLQGGEIELDSDLMYSGIHGATATLRPTTRYEQYFELYDIINELNLAKDIITRFLKLYHMIEYLVYRRELVELEQKARTNRTFIREIHSFTGKSQSDSELNVLKRNFKKIFDAEIAANGFDINPLTVQAASFLRTYWAINVDATNWLNCTDVTNVVNLIYRIRNSIVHNKESEFHITTSNPDEYAEVIALLKKIIEILERQVLDKISSDDVMISYQNNHIELY